VNIKQTVGADNTQKMLIDVLRIQEFNRIIILVSALDTKYINFALNLLFSKKREGAGQSEQQKERVATCYNSHPL